MKPVKPEIAPAEETSHEVESIATVLVLLPRVVAPVEPSVVKAPVEAVVAPIAVELMPVAVVLKLPEVNVRLLAPELMDEADNPDKASAPDVAVKLSAPVVNVKPLLAVTRPENVGLLTTFTVIVSVDVSGVVMLLPAANVTVPP